MIDKIVNYFDKLEDKVRARLSHSSIFYAMIGGTATLLLWRGIWISADILEAKGGILGWIFYSPITVVWCTIILLMTGLFVSIFIGDRIIMSGIKNEKKLEEKTEDEVFKEESEIKDIRKKITQMSKDIEEIKNVLLKK